MRKSLYFSMLALGFLALALTPTVSQACDGDKSTSTKTADKSTLISSKSTCASKSAEKSSLISSKAGCASRSAGKASTSTISMKDCASEMGMTVEECRNLCSDYSLVRMKIDGMTCGGCENSISASLSKVPGVAKVAKVCHESGSAMVFVDPKKVDNKTLTTTVTNKVYKAEIMPAVAVVSEGQDPTQKTSIGNSCSHKKKASENTDKKAEDSN